MLAIRIEQWGEYIHVAFRACLHGGGGPQTCAGSSHLSCKRDQLKIRDYMDKRVTPPKRVHLCGVPQPPCKQAFRQIFCASKSLIISTFISTCNLNLVRCIRHKRSFQ